MILDSLPNAARYKALHPLFPAAFDFLRQNAASQAEAGRHEIQGDALYAMLNVGEGQGHQPLSESHRKYIDIHFILAGTDEIGWKARGDCSHRKTDYDEVGDCELWTDEMESYAVLPPGHFAIYWPEDVHAPGGGQGDFRKWVIKIAVEASDVHA